MSSSSTVWCSSLLLKIYYRLCFLNATPKSATSVEVLLNRGVKGCEGELILAAFNRINQTSYLLDDIEVHVVDEYQEQLSTSTDTRPTFGQVCEQASLTWREVSRGAAVPDTVGYQMYKGAAVFVEDWDDMLAVLSALTGKNWTHAQVGGIRLRSDIWNNPRPRGNEWMQRSEK